MSQRARKRGANHCDWVQAKGTDTCLASAPGGWEFVSKGGEAGGGCPPGPDRGTEEPPRGAVGQGLARPPTPVPYPRAAHRQSSPTARGSGRPRSVGGSGAPATPAAQYLRTRRRDPRIARQHTYRPLQFRESLARGDDVQRRAGDVRGSWRRLWNPGRLQLRGGEGALPRAQLGSGDRTRRPIPRRTAESCFFVSGRPGECRHGPGTESQSRHL